MTFNILRFGIFEGAKILRKENLTIKDRVSTSTFAMSEKNYSDPSLDDEFLLLESDDKNNNDTENITLEEDEGL